MKVILTQDYDKLGSLGDEVEVKPGFARHFLEPKGFAVAITRQNIKRIQRQREILSQERASAIEKSKALKEELSNLNLVFPMKVGEKDKLFGSVTLKNIQDTIKEQGIEIDRKYLSLLVPIKTIGNHNLSVKLHSEVSLEMNIKVIPEVEEVKEGASEDEEGSAPNAETEVVPEQKDQEK